MIGRDGDWEQTATARTRDLPRSQGRIIALLDPAQNLGKRPAVALRLRRQPPLEEWKAGRGVTAQAGQLQPVLRSRPCRQSLLTAQGTPQRCLFPSVSPFHDHIGSQGPPEISG